MKTQYEVVNGVFTEQRIPSLAERIRFWFAWLHWEYLVWSGYYDHDGTPLRCRNCDSWHYRDHEQVMHDSINGHVSEFELKCRLCDTQMGYWAYGCWDSQQGHYWNYL